jgi:hypothetical protein
VALLKQDKYQDALEAIAVRRDAIDVAADELMLEKVGSTPRAPTRGGSCGHRRKG